MTTFLRSGVSNEVWWHMLVVPATQGAEAGRFKACLANAVRLFLKIKSENMAGDLI